MRGGEVLVKSPKLEGRRVRVILDGDVFEGKLIFAGRQEIIIEDNGKMYVIMKDKIRVMEVIK